MQSRYIIVLLAVSLILASGSAAATVGTASIRAPAVILYNNTGSLTGITVNITTGNGSVNVTGAKYIASSTVQSAQTAAMYGANYTGHNFYDYNYTYDIISQSDNVSGPSAGAAMTMLAVSAFENRPLRSDFTMTGTISSNGSIGEIGGVYDKSAAAVAAGMALILVPKVSRNDPEDELYLLVQTNFGIPLVQVANISQAAHFAFNSSINGRANETTLNFYTNYNAESLPNATIMCTSSCNYTLFNRLLNATFKLTNNEVDNLSSNPKFAPIGMQFGQVLNQSSAIARHGYLYTAADIDFLDYVNAFYFDGYPSNRSDALAQLHRIQNFCSSLNPPPLTTSNYNYVINAELRQLWGNYTINQAVQSYNSSQIESDEILDELYLGAQSNGWCTAANLVYNESAQAGTYVAPSSSLKSVALHRIDRALPYGLSLYLVTAGEAYNQSNYPLAILDADYAYALANASETQLPTGRLENFSIAVANNSTFGVWATEFAREAQFYVAESHDSPNQTTARSYAISAYTAALLASQISNDSSTISNSLLVTTAPAAQNSNLSSSDVQKLLDYVRFSQEVIFALLAIVIILLIINIVFINIVMKSVNQKNAKGRKGRKGR